MKEKQNNRISNTKIHKGMLLFYAACAMVLLIAFSIMIFRIMLNTELQDKLEAIRTAGYPSTLEELNDYYPAVPDAENAALLYKQAEMLMRSPYDKMFKKAGESKKSTELLFADEGSEEYRNPKLTFPQLIIMVGVAHRPLLGEHLSPESITANRRFIAANQDCIEMLKKAVKLPKCRFPIDLSNQIFSLRHLNELRSLARLASASTIMAAEAGNAQLATENILTMLKMCHAMDNEPIIISYLVSIAMQAMTVSAIEYTLSLVELDDNSLQQINNALQNCLIQHDKFLKRALIGERIAIINLDSRTAAYYKIQYQFGKFTGLLTKNFVRLST